MQYRENPKNRDLISQLALGCMRFERKAGRINQTKANELVSFALEQGVNFFDTAYIYPGSEEALGIALKNSDKPRDEYKISTKLPHYLCKSYADFDKFFEKQLKRLQAEYIDYYFIHMLNNLAALERVMSFGLENWLAEKIKDGKIKNVGFSFHGGETDFIDILNARDWDFTMVQYNYLDENTQAGASGVRAANKKGLAVFVMAPLRGGLLATRLPPAAKAVFLKKNPSRSMADWALRWLYNQPEITAVLSGMSSISDLKENIISCSNISPGGLSVSELSVYQAAVAALKKSVKVPCTACGYCLPCPKGVDIPTCFNAYNESYSVGLKIALKQYYKNTGVASKKQTDASCCNGCKKCERHCPQKIAIADELIKVKKRMKTAFIMPLLRFIKKILIADN
ncbi:MAG: aldo/keto reductase [Oscillospiraceae bacterium]|nr:aldo/keto reductase [Oscillospiraceae bacterium]